MENNLPVIAKKIWNLVRVAYFLLRKGISKSKLNLLHFNLIMKRGKIAGKAFSNLMFHHHYHPATSPSSSSAADLPFAIGPDQYEFSCTDSPALFPAFFRRARNHHHHHNSFFACAHAPDTLDDDAAAAAVNAVNAVVEILNNHDGASSSSPSPSLVPASPALPGFFRTPRRVRQLRITDSPFPLQDVNADPLVDKAADEFISRFYKELRLQKTADEN